MRNTRAPSVYIAPKGANQAAGFASCMLRGSRLYIPPPQDKSTTTLQPNSLARIEAREMEPDRRLAFWLPSLAVTGIQTSTIRIAEALARQHISVDVVVSYNKGPLSGLVKPPVRVVDLSVGSGRLGRGLIQAIRYVLRERPYALCAYAGSGYVLAGLVYLFRAETQIWIWERSTKGHRAVSRAIEMQRRTLAPRVWRAAVKCAYIIARKLFISMVHGVIANSRTVAQEVAAQGGVDVKKIHLIYNACISDGIEHMPGDREGTVYRVTDGHEVPLILSVGSLSHLKGFDVLLRAFRVLCDQMEADLRIVGEGPCRREIERIIDHLALADRVELAGFRLQPFACAGLADLFVLSSRAESFGNVLVEAMALGLPIVSTDCDGPREILEEGRYGPLVPVGDHMALAEAMLNVLSYPPDREVLRARAMDFHAAKIAGQYRRVLGI